MTLSRRRTFKAFLITALLFFANSLSLRAQNDSFYNGKTVRIIVGSTPGGFYDRWARLLSRYIPKYIAGQSKLRRAEYAGRQLGRGRQLRLQFA